MTAVVKSKPMGISAKQFQERLKPLLNEVHLKNLVNTEIIQHEEELIAIKKDEYEDADIYSTGAVRTYAWKWYSEEKKALNPRAGGYVDLMYSGAFIESFYLKEKGKGYTFDATDTKKNLLTGRYGDRIFDLRQEKFNDFQIKYVYPGFMKALKQQLGQ